MSKFTNIFLIACISSTDVIMAHSVPMTPQIQSLLDEKQQKIKQLEKCEGKKQGWMIAGISTIGLTAVGVVGNVVLANKSKNIDSAINSEKSLLNDTQKELNDINDKIIAEKQNNVDVQDLQNTKKDYTVKFTAEKYGTKKPIVTESAVQKDALSNYDVFNPSENGIGKCYYLVRDKLPTVDESISNQDLKFQCGGLAPGEWMVVFPGEKLVRGISFISENMPSSNASNGTIPNSAVQAAVTNEYNKWSQNGRPLPSSDKDYACYCKMNSPQTGKWVFDTVGSVWALADNCASGCARNVKDMIHFRKSVFTY